MVLLNSRITWLEETHLTYQFVNAFLDRIQWAMLNLFHGEVRQNIWVSLILELATDLLD